jgi:aminoglycoside phosphotransferase (APT) family kinase protein
VHWPYGSFEELETHVGEPHAEERSSALARWLAPRLAPDVVVPDLTTSGEGNSNETLLFTATWDGGAQQAPFVVRIQPTGRTLFRDPDAVREAAVLRHVRATSQVPVPEVLDAESDPSPLGAPFFVMRHVQGRVLADIPSCHATGWLTDLAPDVRARHWDEGLRALADISRVPVQGLPFPSAGGRTPLQQLVAGTRAWFDWAVGDRDVGLIGQAMERVEATVPPHHEAALSWGDARVGNLLYTPDGRIAAVLDWEMAALATPEVDLGWWLATDEFYSTRLGVPLLEGVPDRAATVRRWEELVGRPARDLDWYELLAALRFAIVLVRARDANVAKGVLGEASEMHTRNPMTQQIAALLGEPEPELSPEFQHLLASYSEGRGR